MGGRPCQICASAANLKLAADMIASGASDQSVARKIGGINRMTVSRHRHNHIEAPAKAIVEAAGKGLAVKQEREKTLAAVAAGDEVATFVGLAAIVTDLKGVRDRLERSATAAEEAGMHPVIAQIASQQHKSAEIRGKLGAVGGFAPPKAGAINLPVFTLNLMLSGGRTERIAVSPIIDGQAGEDGEEPLDDMLPDGEGA